jgi:tRNA (guanine37-N1)-methyltransferase
MTFHIITLFPDIFDSYLNESILKRAQKAKKISFKFYNPRDYVKATGAQKGKERPYLRVDDKPYGGGPGMVMQAEPLIKAIEAAVAYATASRRKLKIIFFSPHGKQFDTKFAKSAAKKYSDIILICGRYEGIDARVRKIFKAKEISVGPYVLTGGEVPAMILIDSISRQIKGVLGNFNSLEESRIAGRDVYTRPASIKYKGKTYAVPKVLLSGHHKDIDNWRAKKPRK